MPATGDRITKRKDGLFQGMYTAQTPDGPKRKYIYGRKYKDVETEAGRGDGRRCTRDRGGRQEPHRLRIPGQVPRRRATRHR